jgi:hypothetical protein
LDVAWESCRDADAELEQRSRRSPVQWQLVVVVMLAMALSRAGCRAGHGASRGGDGRDTTTPIGAMTAQERTQKATELMLGFAERTGLSGERAQQRYLWTDAFAVCNFLGLAAATADGGYTQLALRLVDRVHHTLGRHRSDDGRLGWISGLGAQEGEQHPTRGGLRIGKPLPERPALEPFDERLEWDRDGQYFHYLTQWMHALDQVARATGQSAFNVWARELADAAFRGFTYTPLGGARRGLHWKMSIDLTRPLVASMGQHDALDGSIVYAQLEATAARLPTPAHGPSVGDQQAQLAAMFQGQNLTTTDPLGLGGLLIDAFRVQELRHERAMAGDELLETVLGAALVGLRAYAKQEELRLPATRRLAFRELGLAIGLHGIALMSKDAQDNPTGLAISATARARLDSLERYVALGAAIEAFWLEPEHRRVRTWTEHRDINDVMLATSLLPTGFLVLRR